MISNGICEWLLDALVFLRSSRQHQCVDSALGNSHSLDPLLLLLLLYLCACMLAAIVRAGCSTGNVDPNGVHSVANAWVAGLSHVDIYLLVSTLLMAVRTVRASCPSIPRDSLCDSLLAA